MFYLKALASHQKRQDADKNSALPKIIAKVVASAVANSGNEAADCVVTSCRVDNGPVLKRFRPRARGMASGIRKPTAHILVEVEGK